MNDQFHFGTFLWGAVLTVAGALMAAIGLGWWNVAIFDLSYIAPLLLILAGAVILFGTLARSRHNTEKPT